MDNENKIHFSFSQVLVVAVVASVVGGVTSTLFFSSRISESAFNNQPVSTKVREIIEQDEAVTSVVAEATPSVVSIIIKKQAQVSGRSPYFFDPFFDEFFDIPRAPLPLPNDTEPREVGGGTGFIVSSDGLILTNKHVVFDDTAEYSVVTSEGHTYPATVLARDPINDIAIIKIEASGLRPLPLGDSDALRIGQTVIAIGNTLSEYRNTVTRGIVSGVNRRIEAGGEGFSEIIESAIQTDAAINPGNSGGPLLNIRGEVVGVNTAINSYGQSIGFAIPINDAKYVVTSVQQHGKIIRPFLGVRYTIINERMARARELPVTYGALIAPGAGRDMVAVVPGSPADRAGIKEGDIILEVNGQKITEYRGLARELARYQIGEEIVLKILRNGSEREIRATLEERT